MTKNVQDFVTAYNAVNKYLADAIAYDEVSKTAGSLQGDSTAVGLRATLRAMLGTSAKGASYSYLSEIGISMGRDGNLAVDGTKLSAALDNPTAVKSLFAIDNSDPQTNGIARKMKTLTAEMLAYSGTINNRSDALSASVKRNTTEHDKVNARATVVEKRLRATYTALDVKMAGLNALNSYIEQQVKAWSSNGSNN